MDIKGKVAIVTGAVSGIGEAVARALAMRDVKAMALIDRSSMVEQVAASVKISGPRAIEIDPYVGDVTDSRVRRDVFDQVVARHGVPAICVPAAGITRVARSMKIEKKTGKAEVYPLEDFRLVT